MQADNKEKYDLIKDVFNYIKPYLNPDLYNLERKSINEQKAKANLDNKIIQKEFNTDKVEFEVDSVGADVFDDNIPIVMEK